MAQASPDRLMSEIVPWLLVLLGVIVVSAIVIYFIRRSLDTSHEVPDDGFTLHGLRELHARGELTDEEFERAKTILIERTRGATSENSGGVDDGDASGPTTPRAGNA